jgi:hypothetical protein
MSEPEPDVTLDGHAMYLRMAEQAWAQANKATEPAVRAQFLGAATSLAECRQR